MSINNADPRVLQFAIYWLTEALHIQKELIKVNIHLYKDMNISDETDYWSKTLGIDKKNFNKPYIKKSQRINLDHKGHGHGTCCVMVFNTVIKENILMALKVLADNYSR